MFDREQWGEVLQSIGKNKLRAVLTGFAVFWGIFMLIILLGAGAGLRSGFAYNFRNTATNSIRIWGNETSKPWKGFQPNKVWTSRAIKAPVDDVWTVMRDFAGMGGWHEEITKMHMLKRVRSDKVSGIRDFHFGEGHLNEELLHLDDRERSFSYRITNTNPGHNLPSGSLGAQPEIWLNVALVAPDGRTVWESGYVDSNGDMADIHSLDVRAGRLRLDTQLVNLQTKFLTQNVKGTDREVYVPVNFDIDPLPHFRPATVPTTVLNRPPGIRMEARSIPPLGTRVARYEVPAALMAQPGRYRLAVRLRSRAEPIYFMRFVKATREMEQAMNEWMLDIHPYSVHFDVR